RSPEAEVNAVAERDVAVELAVDIEAGGIRIAALVAPPRSGEEHHLRALWHALAMPLDVAGDAPCLHPRRRLEAQQLLDSVRNLARIVDQLPALLGEARQGHPGPSDQPCDRFIAGT